MNKVVFENRNKDYGAYTLRMAYGRNLWMGLLVANIFFVGCSVLLYYVLKSQPEKVPMYKMVDYRTTDFSLEEIKIPQMALQNVVEKPKPKKEEIVSPKPDDTPVAEPKETAQNKDSKATETIEKTDESSPQTLVGENLKSYSTDTTGSELYSNEIFMKVEVPAQFPGGPMMFGKFLADNLQYPEYAREKNVDGIIYVHLIVNNDGSFDDVRIYKGIEESCNNEVLRVVKLSPKWTPARQKGKFVRQRMIIPVHFRSP